MTASVRHKVVGAGVALTRQPIAGQQKYAAWYECVYIYIAFFPIIVCISVTGECTHTN